MSNLSPEARREQQEPINIAKEYPWLAIFPALINNLADLGTHTIIDQASGLFSGKGGDYRLLTVGTNAPLITEVARILQIPIGDAMYHGEDRTRFPTTAESRPLVAHPARKKNFIIIQSLGPPQPDRDINAMRYTVEALRIGGAADIFLILTRFAYGRQERRAFHGDPLEPISAAMHLRDFENNGVKGVFICEPHADAIEGAAKMEIQPIYGSSVLLPRLIQEIIIRKTKKLLLVTPDVGGAARVQYYLSRIKTALMTIDPKLAAQVEIDTLTIYADRHTGSGTKRQFIDIDAIDPNTLVVFLDDEVDTAGSICNAANVLAQRGARDIIGLAVHGILPPVALDRISQSALSRLVITNSLPPKEEVLAHPKIEVVSIAPLIAQAVHVIANGGEVSHLSIHRHLDPQ